MRKPTLVSLASASLLLAAACQDSADPQVVFEPPPAAVCGNDVMEAGEDCDGSDLGATSCADLGFPSGDVGCTATCGLDTSGCEPIDADEDGLGYFDEQDLGTNPNAADSDGDGIPDGLELAGGSNPLDLFSWRGTEGVWPNRLQAAVDAGVTGTGWSVGDVPYDLQVVDQFGNTFYLYQLYGYSIVLSAGAIWCGPCRIAAEVAEEEWIEHVDEGVIFVELLVDGNTFGEPATQEEIQAWADEFGLSFPVVRDGDIPGVTSIPTFFAIDKTFTIRRMEEGYSAAAFAAIIQASKG